MVFCFQVSQDEAIKQKEILANELKCLREELKQIRDDRDHQLGQVNALTGEIAKYKEYTGKTCTQLDTLMIKTNALEVCCFVLLLPFIILFSECILSCGGIHVTACMSCTWKSMRNAIEILSNLRKES